MSEITEGFDEWLESGLDDVHCTPFCSPLTRLVVGGLQDYASRIKWAQTSQLFPSLEELVLTGCGGTEPMWYGLWDVIPSGARQTGDVCCPRLRSVSIVSHDGFEAIMASAALFEGMFHILKHRLERGHKLGELLHTLEHYEGYHDRHYDDLATVVDSVTYETFNHPRSSMFSLLCEPVFSSIARPSL